MHYVNPIHPKKIWLFVVYIKFFGLQFESKREEEKNTRTHQIYNESAFSMQRTTISVENGTELILSCNSIPQYLISVKVCILCCMHIYCLYLSSAFFFPHSFDLNAISVLNWQTLGNSITKHLNANRWCHSSTF